MALLQISEPGQAPNPHERRIAIGIDLGTTHSLVASVRNGVSECLPDDEGRVILPSVVRYGENGVRNMGEDALACADTDPFNTVFSVKRGFFSNPFTLTLSTGSPGASIRYTRDGSTPSEAKGTLYTAS